MRTGLRLLIVEGNGTGAEFVSGEKIVRIGRDAKNDVVLYDTLASRVHCEILRDGDEFTLRDVGSNNGTLLNDQFATEAVLNEGDRFQVGSVVFEFHLERRISAPMNPHVDVAAPVSAAQRQQLLAVKTGFLERPRQSELVRATPRRTDARPEPTQRTVKKQTPARRRALIAAGLILLIGILGSILIARRHRPQTARPVRPVGYRAP